MAKLANVDSQKKVNSPHTQCKQQRRGNNSSDYNSLNMKEMIIDNRNKEISRNLKQQDKVVNSFKK